jgi:hypothetical protein
MAEQAQPNAGTPGKEGKTQVRKLIFALTATLAASLAPTLMVADGAGAATTTERFSFADTSTSAGPPVWSVIATGDFIAGGTATKKGKGVLTLRFAAGTIALEIVRQHNVTSKSQTATACIQTETSSSGSSTYKIAGGTGAYQGISGSGRTTFGATFVEQVVNGDCASAFAAIQSLITASGPVSLP